MSDTIAAARGELSRLVAGEPVAWASLGLTPDAFQALCEDEGVTALVHHALRQAFARSPSRGAAGRPDTDWPAAVRGALANRARALAAQDLVRARETARVLDALTHEGIAAVLFKGTALAYGTYDAPGLRPRSDTDVVIRRADVGHVRRVMAGLGYLEPNYCDGELLFRQFEMNRHDEFGVCHAFDFHWSVSTQAIFARLLGYDELAAEAVPLPGLGAHARAAGPLHALLIACVHPVMHHRNEERIIWIHDVHLLAAGLGPAEWRRFVDLALARQVGRISAHSLSLARDRLHTVVPDAVIAALETTGGEPSAAYLEPGRRWGAELVSNLAGLPGHAARWRLLREILLPAPAYMLRAYGLKPGLRGALLLPALYLHRGLSGGLRALVGRK